MPVSVIHDTTLTLAARVVFSELTAWAGPGKMTISRGQRAIAAAIGVHQRTVGVALQQLAARGHLRIHGTGRQRRRYTLLSPVFRFTTSLGKDTIEYSRQSGIIQKRIIKS